jgi:hypothetical protein
VVIDVAVGPEWALSEMYEAPGARVAVAARPWDRLEVQVAAATYPWKLGWATRSGERIGDCFCSADIPALGTLGEATVGVYPARATHGAWTVEVGLRVGAAPLRRRWDEYDYDHSDETVERQALGDPAWRVGWVVAGVAEASRGHGGARLRLEEIAWVEADAFEQWHYLAPGVEGFLRW